MSNSIWKTREEKPKSFSFILEHYKSYNFDNNKDINAYNVFKTSGNPQNPFDGNTIRWCYLDDLIAQADKAERLQKAVDLAVDVLETLQKIMLETENHLQSRWVESTVFTIKQLIKE